MELFLPLSITVVTIVVFCVWRAKLLRLRGEFEALKSQLELEKAAHHTSVASEHERQIGLFNSMTEGVLVLDAEGRVQMTNQAFERLFDLTFNPKGRLLIEAVRSHDLLALVTKVSREGRPETLEINPAGKENLVVEVNGAPFSASDKKLLGVVLVFHDVTRVKQLENTRQEFVANVSHELRTPLHLIKGAAETLAEGAKGDPESASRFLQMILKHTDRLTFLIEDLLTISKLESGQVLMNFQRQPVAPIVRRVVEDLQQKAGERTVTLRNEIPPNLEAHLDSDRIQQVFLNLIDNAIHYGAAGGWVLITGAEQPDGTVLLAIEDNGPGIPSEAQERVFERFFRLNRARSREHGGTGLGLSIVKHIVQAHGGQVWVESAPEKGARFCFKLPPHP